MNTHDLDPEARIAFQRLLRELRRLAWAPEFRAIGQAIAQRPAVGALAPRDRPRDADELGPHFVAAELNRRIAMSTHVDEFQVRREPPVPG